MKKSKLLSVLSLALITSMLASCGEKEIKYERPFKHLFEVSAESTSGEPQVKKEENGEIILINNPETDPKVIGVQSLSIDVPTFSLFYSNSKTKAFAETKQLKAVYLPSTAKASAFTWSSDHPEIASVDAKTGLVTAVSEGTATISVSSSDGFVAKSHVVVNNDNVSITKSGQSAAEILKKQATMDAPNDIYVREDYENVVSEDGVVKETAKFAQKIWASKKEAYMRITSDDQNVLCEGGSTVLSKVDYIFYTTDLYYTYVFSTKVTSKNYMVIDQSNLAEKGYSRYEAMCLVLESFFTSGKDIIDNQYADLYSSEELQTSSFQRNKYCGSLGQYSEEFSYNIISSGTMTTDYDDEEDLGIPAGTKVTLTDDLRYLWEGNLLTAKHIDEQLDYEINGKPCNTSYVVDYYYQTENVKFHYPTLSEYTRVSDIFSL